MELVFAYGSPIAMWRDLKMKVISSYMKVIPKIHGLEKEFNSSIENTNNNSQQQSMLGTTERIYCFHHQTKQCRGLLI